VGSVPILRVVQGSGLSPEEPVDTHDLGALFTRYAPYVGTIALRLTGRPHEVDDLVQDVFLAAHRGLKRRENENEIKGWLARVTVRLAKRRLHTLKIKGFFGVGDHPAFERIAHGDASPEQSATLAAIYRVLETQPVGHRIAWLLRCVDDHPLAEVAELCGCSLATVKRRIADTSAVLKEAFGDS
jgi:RNA polymerase sigma-70 factor, ECF subfamily